MIGIFFGKLLHLLRSSDHFFFRKIDCKRNEFISPDPEGQLIPELFADCCSDALEHLVAGIMSFLLIDLMKTIGIRIDTGKLFLILPWQHS